MEVNTETDRSSKVFNSLLEKYDDHRTDTEISSAIGISVNTFSRYRNSDIRHSVPVAPLFSLAVVKRMSVEDALRLFTAFRCDFSNPDTLKYILGLLRLANRLKQDPDVFLHAIYMYEKAYSCEIRMVPEIPSKT